MMRVYFLRTSSYLPLAPISQRSKNDMSIENIVIPLGQIENELAICKHNRAILDRQIESEKRLASDELRKLGDLRAEVTRRISELELQAL